MNISTMKDVLMDDLFFSRFCTRRYNGMSKLNIHGSDLYRQIGRRFHDTDVCSLLHFLKNNSDVASISLPYNTIHCQGFMDIINYMTEHNEILELNVQNNEIRALGIEKMCVEAPKLKLKALRLSGNKIRTKASKDVALMLLNNSHIEYLDIAEVDQTLTSLVHFVTVLRSDQDQFNNTLKVLDISRPNPPCMNTFDSAYFATIIGSMLNINTCLTELYLQKFSFSCHDIELMLLDGRNNRTLQLLDLGCNNIGDYGTELIFNWLTDRPALAGLVLSHNIITNLGARILSFALPYSRIQLLDISYNNIGDSGITDILNTIKKSTTMRFLKIFGNKIEHRSAVIIERMLTSAVLVQENLDVKPYIVDKKYFVAYYPVHDYKQEYFDDPYCGTLRSLRKFLERNNLQRRILPKHIFKHANPTLMNSKQSKIEENLSKDNCNDCVSLKETPTLSRNQSTFKSDYSSYSDLSKEHDEEHSYHCYCKIEGESLSSDENTSSKHVTNDPMQKVMQILGQVDGGIRDCIMKLITAADVTPHDVISVDDKVNSPFDFHI